METTQPTISKQIAALEKYLDVQLLVRSTRKVSLTDEGIRFYEQTQHVLEALSEDESSVGKRQNPSGLLRINCSVALGRQQLFPRLKRFLDRYPDITLDVTMSDYFVDLVEEGIDLAIRTGATQDHNLCFHPIGTSPLWAFSKELRNQSVKIILADYEPEPLTLRAVYRRSRFQPAKIKCFIDFLVDEFKTGLLQ